jgi:hypothetical protein
MQKIKSSNFYPLIIIGVFMLMYMGKLDIHIESSGTKVELISK